ncbi:hypothetical protein [Limnoglobus roseus]|uniref:hypothetical protein n=1 Tax=Limnoglobus roseus TaxID=2598579 RepID=UPI00143D1ABC|nr:hypothetical protein [Limnoglobus roseus]
MTQHGLEESGVHKLLVPTEDSALQATDENFLRAVLTAVGTALYFNANDTNGYRLWKTDGTATGTARLSTSDDYYNGAGTRSLS